MSMTPEIRLGPYEVLAPLGSGGMGEVYRARDTRLDRTVAIKVLPAQLSSEPERRELFERQARAVSSLNHPHICALYDVGQDDGTDYIVMEHLEGQMLAERLDKGPLPTETLLRHTIEIADALDAGLSPLDRGPGQCGTERAPGCVARAGTWLGRSGPRRGGRAAGPEGQRASSASQRALKCA